MQAQFARVELAVAMAQPAAMLGWISPAIGGCCCSRRSMVLATLWEQLAREGAVGAGGGEHAG